MRIGNEDFVKNCIASSGFRGLRISFAAVRRLLIILLLLMYSFSSAGVSLYVHYCCGKVAGVDITPRKGKHCPADSHHFSKACCADEVLSFSIKDSHEASSAITLQEQLQPAVVYANVLPVAHPLVEAQGWVKAHAPPSCYGSSILPFICVFRI